VNNGSKIRCTSERSSPLRNIVSKMFVDPDGLAYVAFTRDEWAVTADACPAGGVVEARDITFARDHRVGLRQIHADGTYRDTVVEESNVTGPLLNSTDVSSPTGEIIPDGFDGVLLAMRSAHNSPSDKKPPVPAEFVYRIDGEGKVLYRSLLPSREGELKDGMVLGENNIAYTTRGTVFIAFHVTDGSEAWRWDSGIQGIEVFAALADGSCLVQTPKALVDVISPTNVREVFEGKARVDWQGKLYRQSESDGSR
jgi:hypothetical protein